MREQHTGNRDHRRLHRFISYVFEPSLVAAPLMMLLIYTRRHLFTVPISTVYLWMGLFGAFIPVTYTLILYKFGRITSVFYTRRRDRIYFYPLILGCEFLIFMLLAYTTISRDLTSTAFAALATTFGLAILTAWQKISYHLAGLGGLFSIATALVGVAGFLVLPLMVLVAYSRTRLGEHTWLQVTVGGLYGMLAAALAFRWFHGTGYEYLAWLPGR